MPVTSVNRIKSIIVPLSASSGSSIVTLYENLGVSIGSELFPGHTVVSFNCFVKNLKAFASVQSLPTAPLPDFRPTDSQTQKLVKTLDIEWASPRKQLNLFIGLQGQGDAWSQVGSMSMLNPYGYPFRVYNLMDLFTDNLALELGSNSKIGVSVQNVGYGVLTEQDRVTIHGSYVEEIFVKYDDPLLPPINVYNQIQGIAQSSSSPDAGNNTTAGNESLAGN